MQKFIFSNYIPVITMLMTNLSFLSLYAIPKKIQYSMEHPIVLQLLAHHGGDINQLLTLKTTQGKNSVAEIKKQLADLALSDKSDFITDNKAGNRINPSELKRIQDGALYYFAQTIKLTSKGELSAQDWSVFKSAKRRLDFNKNVHSDQDKGVRYQSYLDSISQTGSVQALREISMLLKEQSYYVKRPSETYQLLLLTQQIIQGTSSVNESIPSQITTKKVAFAPLSTSYQNRFSQQELFNSTSEQLLAQVDQYLSIYSNPNFGLSEGQGEFLTSFAQILKSIKDIKKSGSNSKENKITHHQSKTRVLLTQKKENDLNLNSSSSLARGISSINNNNTVITGTEKLSTKTKDKENASFAIHIFLILGMVILAILIKRNKKKLK